MGMTNPIPSKYDVSAPASQWIRRKRFTEAEDRGTTRIEPVRHDGGRAYGKKTYPIKSGKSFSLNIATLATPCSAMRENSLEKI